MNLGIPKWENPWRRYLYASLGFPPNEIPLDVEGFWPQVMCYDWYWNPMGLFDVTVEKNPQTHTKSSRHRVFVTCPDCGKRIPFGRLRQHSTVHISLEDLPTLLGKGYDKQIEALLRRDSLVQTLPGGEVTQ